MQISIRTASMDDFPALQQLIPLSGRELSKDYCTPQQIDSANKYIFGVDTQLIADQTYYLAEAMDQVVGCGGWSKRKTLFGGDKIKETADPMLDPRAEAARIRAFFVHPEWARKGIGRRLIETCEDAARLNGFSRMELAATLPGEPLYSAMGYEVTRRLEYQMPDGTSLPLAYMHKQLA